jgi:hypothetical protein
MQLCLLLYVALYAVCRFATQGTLHVPMGVQAAAAIHCWNGFASLGTSSFAGVVFFIVFQWRLFWVCANSASMELVCLLKSRATSSNL